MPTYVRKAGDEIAERISPEPGGPEDMRLAAACRADEPAWEVAEEPESEELRTMTSADPVTTVERPEVPVDPPAQGRPPKGPQKPAKADESSGEG